MGSTPKVSKPPTTNSDKVQQAEADEIRRNRMAKGRKSTQLSDMYAAMKTSFGA